MYVFKKSRTSTKVVISAIAVYLLFFKVEGFMSTYDGVILKVPEKPMELISPSIKISPLLGTSYAPLTDYLANDQDDTMFLFKDNLCTPACCPSTYSCNGGCVCTTEQQKKIGRQRFGNNPKPSEDMN
tara:strand:- start:899 stop:1282 length:384 start_codon:yes stop_codon:yes gene_type:complete